MITDLSPYRAQIEAALEHEGGAYTFADIQAGVDDRSFQVWAAPHSIIITQISVYPQYKSMHFFLAGGVMSEMEAMTPIILDWGTKQGCTKASLIGRPGWQRSFLSRTGWSKSNLIMMETSLAPRP